MPLEVTYIPAETEKKEKGKRAVIYARYSSSRQNTKSIEQQIDECMIYIKFKNYELVDTYKDRAKSASHATAKRTEFLRMLDDAKKDMFDVVVAYSVDRISREENGKYYEYERLLNETGVRLEYSSTPLGSDEENEMYDLQKAYYVSMASMKSKQIRRDTTRGMVAGAKEGLYSGGGSIPMGYSITEGDANGKRKRYIVDAEKAPYVHEAFDMYLTGKTTKEIANFLTDKGFRTFHGGDINRDTINRMLSNPIYKGTRITQFDNKIEKGTYIVENACEAIITEEEWNRVQQEKKRRSHSGEKEAHRETYLLRGKLYCGTCGAEMVAHKGKGYHYYCCKERKNRKTTDPKRCTKLNVSKQVIEDTVFDILTNRIMNEESITFYLEASKKAESQRIINPQISELKASISKHKSKKKKAMDAYLESGDSDWKDAANKEQEQIKNDEEKLKALEKIEENTMSAADFEEQLNELREMWDELCSTAAGKISIINNFVDKIFVYDSEDPNDPTKVKIKLIISSVENINTSEEITVEIDVSQLENELTRVTKPALEEHILF